MTMTQKSKNKTAKFTELEFVIIMFLLIHENL